MAMDEATWLTSYALAAMLNELKRQRVELSARKVRLFVCAYRRCYWNDLDNNARTAVVRAERFADGQLSTEELSLLNPQSEELPADPLRLLGISQTTLYWPTLSNILRELVGNPFRPITVNPAWLRWGNGVVEKMTWTIYDERRFADMPVLADALEDAGCDNVDLLAHLRAQETHVLGCWALDALLGKG